MNSVNEAIQIILGDKTVGYYLAGFFFSFLAILVSLWSHSRTRDKYSSATPVDFSWGFLLWDNLKRVVVTLIVMFMLFRLFDLSNAAAMIGVGFSVGFGLDKIIQFLMDRTNLLDILKPERKKHP